ncbi:hypothetical protein B0I72DRAFT_142016 [Yarrowia lipolytica]|uniref:YALI0F10197p n=2 Tax=Yarrowia lipolytica TaxID=4952 RepID=Q6C273_YARLI|nr:YALI0F10197p [Yarrowia lipolytica CLIB122]AOW06940.1 hypothetical protein YALI1_F13875g [Yarrowia lipolytica]KAB8284007.1 hypothetical protein BKA91DRAFT_135575 [Yarrowia lipolytica]KAE8173594.1 hypothetical protein BKA90DRAFT_135208 [Yarrowia lipolytica]KAJ8055880.1 hypothetical protein LXG23DRAFT_57411 [Yarrowia lipolytica]QNQ01232.1 D-amino-acid oxidase [Yarrowia lipolytica]|eukprot:XP_505239.1 YALI0F10197p [Yarrowia lipolytica CLIB122]
MVQKDEKIAILGAGITGLYIAYILTEKGYSNIHMTAQYLPGDTSIDYTSPWAGGNFCAISGSDPATLVYDKETYLGLAPIFDTWGAAKGFERLPITEFWDFEPPKQKIESLKTYLKDFQILPSSELPEGAKFGVRYLTYNFNCPVVLVSFKKYLESKGVTFERKTVQNLSDAFGDAKVLFNATGLGARTLGEVEDKRCFPTRGQVVVVRVPSVKENRVRWGTDYATYIIPRPGSGGHVVCGGFLQKDRYTASTFGEEAEDIIRRTTQLMPELKGAEIVRDAAGLRPSREGGVRIERQVDLQGRTIIHDYGAGGAGYQSGYGMAKHAISLMEWDSKL